MKIKIGIIGYGNLGKACTTLARLDARFEIVGIFSRRDLSLQQNSPSTCPFYHLDDVSKFAGKIDVMLVCVGSNTDAPKITPLIAKHFSTVDSYDNHAQLTKYLSALARAHAHTTTNTNIKVTTNSSQTSQISRVSIVGAGWDPGLFSVLRVYLSALNMSPQTFWGRGISLGHSNAIKQIDGVIDAIQFTVPKRDAIKSARAGTALLPTQKHDRVCYVVAPPSHHARIKERIKTMPDYFEGYNVIVNFISKTEFNKRFKNTKSHAGRIIARGEGSFAEFLLKLKSNPEFTARAILAYAVACHSMSRDNFSGAYTIDAVAPKYLLDNINLI